jgi:hypothetical protein
VAHNQGQPSIGGVRRNTKFQKRKSTQESEQQLSAALSTRKSKDKTENCQSVNKEDSDKYETKKQSRNKNKKSVDVIQELGHALLGRKIEDTENRSKFIAIETNKKKEPLNQKVVPLCRLGSDKEKQGVLQGKIISKTGSEISRSKKRRIRKRRLLESLGINIINPIKSAKERSATKKRKKKKNKKEAEYVADSDAVRENHAAVKSVNLEATSRSEGTSCDVVGKRGAVKKSEGIVEEVDCTAVKIVNREVRVRSDETGCDVIEKGGAERKPEGDVVEESDCRAVKVVSREVRSKSGETSCDAEVKNTAVKNFGGVILKDPLHKDYTALKLVNREIPGRCEEINFNVVGKKSVQRNSEDIVIEESYHTTVKSVNLNVTNRREETNSGIVGKKEALRNYEDTGVEESDCADVKLVSGKVTDRSEKTGCGIKGTKQTINSFEDTVSVVPKLEDSHPARPPEQVTEVEESKLEKNIFIDTLPEVKEGNSSFNSSTAVEVCSSCEELQCNRELSSGCKVTSEDISHQFLSKKEESSTSGRADLVSFLYHDNIEALFRSAVLNDVTSSRCSEKEVKNFFNTYGTFSERGRTQFAAVEKLLHSSSKGGEEHFEPALNKDISPDVTPQNSVTITDKELDLNSSTSALTLVGSPRCDHFALKDIKNSVDTDELGSLENCCSYNQVVRELKPTDSEGINLVFGGGFSRGPIYTSPNPENRVTNSASSSQIQNSACKVFVPDTYESCDFPSVQKLDSDLVHSENDFSVKWQFTSGDKTELSEVCNVSEQSFACSTSPRLKDSYKEQSLDKTRSAEVNIAECQVNHVHKNGVIECRTTEDETVTESCPSEHAECPKEQKPIPIGLNNICEDKEEEVSENCSGKVPRNGNAKKYRWTGFVLECAEDIWETEFDASGIQDTEFEAVEEGQGTDRYCHISPSEISHTGILNESSHGFHTDSDSKEQKTLPNCSVTEVSGSESIEFRPIPSSEDKIIMNHPQRKTMESKITMPERSREEVLAAREAKKTEKLARNKNKVVLSANVSLPENVIVSKSQSMASPSQSKQQPKLTTEAGKNETEYAAEVASLSKNSTHCPGVKQLNSPLLDASYQKSKIENKIPLKRTELKKKTDELQEAENRVFTTSTREDEASRTTEILEEKVKDTGHGPQTLAILPAPKSKAELRAERRAKQVIYNSEINT